MKKFKTISHETLREKIDKKSKFVLLETAPAEEFNVGHLPGARNLPFASIESGASDLIPGKDSRVVVYGAGSDSDASEKSATKLASMGYTRVYHFAGGKAEWNETKKPALTL